jgi:GAF domain-containing protein
MPIKSTDGRVLGTLGTYYRSQRNPSVDEIAGVRALALVAAEAIAQTT